MAFSDIFLDELIQRNDIADVVGSYVPLTKKSGSNLFGLCPFHNEKSPSFSVSTDKQIYHCFGCGKGGGVVNFIMEIERLSYVDAVHVLAKRAGLSVPDESTSKETQSRRARILELNRDAARFFYTVLMSNQGDAAKKYIVKRGISKDMVTRFGLGAAPDSWNTLYDAMIKKGYTRKELLDAGLVKAGKNDGVYDFFRNRLVFPVIDVRGSVIGFSGRILGDGEPKYLNSPDTLVYEKSRNLFALNLAKKTKAGMLILTEGNIDVVSLHQAGFDAAVASLGTALTEEQARLMSRYTQNVVIAYDMDAAGAKASQRAIGILERTGLQVRVLRMNDAKDPDEFIGKFGRDAFTKLLERSEYHIEYRLQAIKAKHNLETNEGRVTYLNEATDMLSRIESALEREIYAERIAETAGVTAEAVKNEIKKAFKRRLTADKKKQDAREMNVAAGFQPGDKTIRYDNVYSAAAEEGLIRLLALDGELFKVVRRLEFRDSEFTSLFLQKIFEVMRKRREDGLDITQASILAELNNAEAAHFLVILQRPESMANGETAMQDYIEKIRAEKRKNDARADPLAVLQQYRDKSGCGG